MTGETFRKRVGLGGICVDCRQSGFDADTLPSDEERIPTFKNAIFKLGGVWSVEKFALVQLLREMQKVEIVA